MFPGIVLFLGGVIGKRSASGESVLEGLNLNKRVISVLRSGSARRHLRVGGCSRPLP